ncbi:ketopantoate reductase family protein [Streptomyces sp. NPDC054844]
MRILVVGAGATGGHFGGLLAAAGRDVTFLVRPARAAGLRTQGLRLTGPQGDVHIPDPALVTPKELAQDPHEPFELVLLSVKSYGLRQAVTDIAPAVGPDTLVLPVLNGMAHLDVLDTAFGPDAVLGGLCLIASTLAPDGRIVQLEDFHQITFGPRTEPAEQRSVTVQAALDGAGFHVRRSPAILQEMWEKWYLLASLAAVTTLMRGSVGEIMAAPGGAGFIEGVLAEVETATAAAGHPVGEQAKERAHKRLLAVGSPLTASMFRDLSAGLPVEAEHIIGDMVDRGARNGVPMPLLALARTHLAVYEKPQSR